MACAFQCLPDRTDATIHHVGRSQDICPHLGLSQGHFHQGGDGFVVDDLSVADKPVMAVDVIRVERDIGHHRDPRCRPFDGADRLIGDIVGRPGHGTIFGALVHGCVRKNTDRRNPKGLRLDRGLGHPVHSQPRDTWHRRNRCFLIHPFHHEHRPDEILRRQGVFTDQIAQSRCRPQSAKPGGGEGGDSGFHRAAFLG